MSVWLCCFRSPPRQKSCGSGCTTSTSKRRRCCKSFTKRAFSPTRCTTKMQRRPRYYVRTRRKPSSPTCFTSCRQYSLFGEAAGFAVASHGNKKGLNYQHQQTKLQRMKRWCVVFKSKGRPLLTPHFQQITMFRGFETSPPSSNWLTLLHQFRIVLVEKRSIQSIFISNCSAARPQSRRANAIILIVTTICTQFSHHRLNTCKDFEYWPKLFWTQSTLHIRKL